MAYGNITQPLEIESFMILAGVIGRSLITGKFYSIHMILNLLIKPKKIKSWKNDFSNPLFLW